MSKKTMEKELHILILEDVPTDAELMERELRKEGIAFSSRRVETREDFIKELEDFSPDLILADYSLPSFDGISALAIVQKKCPEVPFIFVTGSLGEEVAIETLKKGATDYIMKDKLSRLLPAVKRALQEGEERTERKRAEETLRETRDYLENLLNYANAPIIVWDSKFRITRFNHAFEHLTGYTADEVIGKELYMLFPEASKDKSLNKIVNTLSGEYWKSVEIPILRKDGSIRIVLWNSANIYTEDGKTLLATIAQGVDITEHKHAEETIRQSEAKFRILTQEFNAILDTIPDSLTLLSSDLKVLWTNHGAAAALGKDISDLVGQYCYKLWFNRSTPCLAESCPSVRSFRTGNPESENISTPDGRLWDVRTFPVKDEEGKVLNVIKLDRDITAHRKLEAQLLQAQKMEAVGQLTGGIAHDFNNILTAIVGYSSLLQMKMSKDDPLRHNADQILASTERAANLVQSLLAFSRKQIINLQPVTLNGIVKRVEKLLLRLIGEDIDIKTILTEEDLTIMADPGQIEQVLINLATNARDAMPDGGHLTIKTGFVNLDNAFITAHGYGKPGIYTFFTVTDTGAGIDDKTREKIFEPFFTTKEVGKGTGLGLSIVYGIIKQHNGYIDVYSAPGKGTTFVIYLPLIKAEVKELKPTEPPPTIGGTETILLAEDDEDVRKFTKHILEEFGYTVIDAEDGEDAINKFMQNKDKIHLLMLDAIMPKKSGKNAYEKIKKLRPDMKALFMSGYSKDVLAKEGILEEGLTFVLKPISPTELLRKIREVLEK